MSKRRPMFYRRRRRGMRVTVVLIVVAVLAAAGVEVVTASTGSQPGHPQAAVNGAASGAGHAVRRRHRDARAIDRVLRYTPFIAAGTPRRRVMALTFDDGPSPYTPAIVRTLVRLHVPATFFIVGQQLGYFSAGVRDELRHGFEVGDHTENHAWLVRLGSAAQRTQVAAVAGQVKRLGGPAPRLFRPPYGVWNSTTMATLHRLRMLMVLWSIDPGDWRRPGTKAIVTGVLSHSKPGAIVILHDGGGDRSETAAALPAIIRGLRRRGYALVSVPRLLALDPPGRHQRIPPLGAA